MNENRITVLDLATLRAGGLVAALMACALSGCDGDSGTTSTGGGGGTGGSVTGGGGAGGGTGGTMVSPQHEQICKQIQSGAGKHDGYAIPGVAGASRWGIPQSPPAVKRVRKSWSSLDDAGKKKVVDAFLALKNVTTASGDPGSERANYVSFCDELGLQGYATNLYDYYVETHANAFISMMTPHEAHDEMAHMGPKFLPWHRYLLLRLEADMGEAIGDPEFALPYWDWTDCHLDGDPKTCAPLFDGDFLGSTGSCDDASSAIDGYLIDQGFLTNIYTENNPSQSYDPASIKCGQIVIRRNVGCATEISGPPDSAAVNGIFDRLVYDTAPYDSCYTEEDTSFRQYLEGFDNDDTVPLCIGAGCTMHGAGHVFIGGDMQFSSANPNDPIFFLHHAQVDRMWAAWQEANLASGEAGRMVDHGNPGYPEDFRGGLFNWSQVEAAELFDYEALGYEYDALPAGE